MYGITLAPQLITLAKIETDFHSRICSELLEIPKRKFYFLLWKISEISKFWKSSQVRIRTFFGKNPKSYFCFTEINFLKKRVFEVQISTHTQPSWLLYSRKLFFSELEICFGRLKKMFLLNSLECSKNAERVITLAELRSKSYMIL